MSMRIDTLLTGIARCAALAATLASLGTSAFAADSLPAPYVTRDIHVPADKDYAVGPDTAFVAGNDVLIPLFKKLDALWAEKQPNIKFKKIMMGSTLSVEGLTSGKSAFGPIGRYNRCAEADGFAQRFGYPPTYFKIGYDSNPNNKLSTGIWVNAANPIKQITLAQAAAVFTTGSGHGDITHWSQLGVGGEWGAITIHPYVTRDTSAILAMIDEMRDVLGGHPFTPRVEWMPTEESAIDAVALDAYGVEMMDYWNNTAPMNG